jgi:tetratricopeptide (TPR) repeat protein
MQYKGARKPLPEIAKELGVKAVIEGSVMRDGDRVRITAQLIEAESDRHMWADSYERNLTDIFALQRDIAQAIAGQVKVTLTPSEQKRFHEVQQIDPRAYEAYLKGIHHVIQVNPSDYLKSLDYFSQAVEIEPDFALGYVGIARACVGLMDFGGLPFSELYPKAKSALEKALQLDNSLAEAYSVQGKFKNTAEWDWAGAERAFRKALELNPNLAKTYHDYAIFLTVMGRQDEALTMNIKARSLDPLNAAINNDVAWISYWARRYDAAIREYQNNLEMFPDFIMSHRELGYVYAKKSRFKEAIQSMQRAIALERSAFNLAQLAIVYAMAGQKDEAYEILNELLSTRQTEHLLAYDFVMIHTALGDLDEAFRWLEKSYQEHSVPFLIKTDPLAEPLHFDPRYAAFLRKMGLEP